MVARSNAEAEFRSMAHDVCKLLWLKRLLIELSVFVPHLINIAHNLVQYDRTKPIEVDRHFIKEKLKW